MYSSRFLWIMCIVRRVVEARISGTPCFLCQSLLLSTIVLNDTEILAMFLNDKSRDFRF